MQFIDSGFFTQAIFLLALIIAGTACVRAIWCIFAKRFGLWNPEHFHWLVWIPWRAIEAFVIPIQEWIEEIFRIGRQSTAGWTGLLSRLALVCRPGHVLLGRLRIAGIGLFQPLGFKAERHLAMVAGTGAGKTTLVITMLGLHRGNAFVIDPKWQITRIIASRRGSGSDSVRGLGMQVTVLDPYKIVEGQKRACWNAIDELSRVEKREGKDGVVKYAMKMAEGIVPMDGSKPYFPKTAREFLQGLILHVYTTEPAELRHLVRVRDLATRGYDEFVSKGAFEFLLEEMRNNPAFDGVIANAGASLAGAGRSYGDILSTLRSALKFLDLPEMREISRHSDFSLEDLKLGSLNLFLCAPTNAIREELSNWFRLLSITALDLFEKIPGNLRNPCLFAIDEMPSLGHIEAVETAAPVMRSYGVRLLAVTQDLEKLQKAYPKGWRGFLGNADAVYWMGTNEDETAEFLSKRLGDQTRKERRGWIPFLRKTVGKKEKATMTPDQVSRFLEPRRNNMIVTRFGKRSLRVKTMPYFRELLSNLVFGRSSCGGLMWG